MITDRKLYIGGSDAAPILGLSKWQTPYQTYLKKRGEWEPEITPERQKLFDAGRFIEPVIRNSFMRKWWEENNQSKYSVYYDDSPEGKGNWVEYDYPEGWEGPRIGGNLDGFILTDSSILECKNVDRFAGMQFGQEDTDDIRADIICQCQHYMMCKKSNKAHAGVLIGGNDFRCYQLYADNGFHEIMLKAYISFWECVKDGNPPDAVNNEDLKLMYKQDDATEIVTNNDISVKLANYRELKDMLSDIKNRISLIEVDIKKYMRENAYLVDREGNKLVSWKTNKNGVRVFLA